MENYTKFMNWALFTMVDRSTQDDHRSKINVEALFRSPVQAEDNYKAPNNEIKRYLLSVDELEQFEEFYNHVQDINEKYGDYAIYHIGDNFITENENKFRTMLGIWTDTKIT